MVQIGTGAVGTKRPKKKIAKKPAIANRHFDEFAR